MILLELYDFLNPADLMEVKKEVMTIDWPKCFDRAGSCMYENNEIHRLPVLTSLYAKYSSKTFLQYLESNFNTKGILPDPYLIGAGYSKIDKSNDLKFHVDFNWNDTIKLHRICSLIIYLNEVDGGDLEFEGIGTLATSDNKAIIFEHSETIRHRVTNCNNTRYAVRFFYYASKAQAPDNYHRSLYGIADGKAVDIP